MEKRLDDEILLAAQATGEAPFRKGAPKEPVIKKLWGDPGGFDPEMLKVIVTGLIAGTIGNVRVAVSIAIHDFFTRNDDQGRPLIDEARRAAREDGSKIGRTDHRSAAAQSSDALPRAAVETASGRRIAVGVHR